MLVCVHMRTRTCIIYTYQTTTYLFNSISDSQSQPPKVEQMREELLSVAHFSQVFPRLRAAPASQRGRIEQGRAVVQCSLIGAQWMNVMLGG